MWVCMYVYMSVSACMWVCVQVCVSLYMYATDTSMGGTWGLRHRHHGPEALLEFTDHPSSLAEKAET